MSNKKNDKGPKPFIIFLYAAVAVDYKPSFSRIAAGIASL